MKSKSRIFLPNRLSVLAFVALILFDAYWFSLSSGSLDLGDPKASWSMASIGAGPAIDFLWNGGVRTVEIHWFLMLANLGGAWILASLLAAGAERTGDLRRPALVFGGATVAIAFVAFLAAICFSKSYWGYWFERPGPLAEARRVERVVSLTPIVAASDPSGNPQLRLNADFSLGRELASAESDPYDGAEERIALLLQKRELLAESPPADPRLLDGLYDRLAEGGLLAASDEGYHSADRMHGLVLDTLDDAGGRMVFVCARGGEVSNDHYPYYEMLFTSPTPNGPLNFARGQSFFFDVAGMEGAEWYAFWFPLALIGFVAGFPLLAAGLLWRKFIRSRRRPGNSGGIWGNSQQPAK